MNRISLPLSRKNQSYKLLMLSIKHFMKYKKHYSKRRQISLSKLRFSNNKFSFMKIEFPRIYKKVLLSSFFIKVDFIFESFDVLAISDLVNFFYVAPVNTDDKDPEITDDKDAQPFLPLIVF